MTENVFNPHSEEPKDIEHYSKFELFDDLDRMNDRLEGLALALRGARNEMSGDCYANGLERLCADCCEAMQDILESLREEHEAKKAEAAA
jgi:hypothetical protein